MFSKIDNKLINAFQWLVRQTELFTDITRKDILSFALLLLKYIIVGYLLSSMIEDLLLGQAPLFSFINLVLMFRLYQLEKRSTLQEPQPGALPVFIVWGRSLRALILFLVILYGPIRFYFSGGNEIDLSFVKSCFYEGWLIANLVIEYLLCTAPLPPGEKEKKKQEKEMRKAVPTAA